MKLGKILYWLLVTILSVTFLVSGCFVARYTIDALRQKSEYNELAALVEQARSETEPRQATVPQVTEPAEMVERMREEIREIMTMYEKT